MEKVPGRMRETDRSLDGSPEGRTMLRAILEGTAGESGQRFFARLVQNFARALGTYGAWVTEYLENRCRLRALTFWLNDR
jgi:hypothetical protein